MIDQSEELISSVSIEALLAARDHALQSYESIAEQLRTIKDNLSRFQVDSSRVDIQLEGGWERPLADEKSFDEIREDLDRRCWAALFSMSQITTLMSAKKREELRKKLHDRRPSYQKAEDALPPLTADNIRATFEGIHANRGEFFEECVESVYKSLSWDHKTNAPAKLKPRMILQYAVDNWGSTASMGHGYNADTVRDLERVLHVLTGRQQPTYETGVRSLGSFPYGEWIEVPSPGGEPLFKVKGHKSRTLHVWVHDESLVDSMNRIMARRYPGSIPESQESKNGRRRGCAT